MTQCCTPLWLEVKFSSMLASSTSSELSTTPLTGRASHGCATCAQRRHSLSWNRACPQSLWTCSTAWWSTSEHVFFPETAGDKQPMIAHCWLRELWDGQNRWWLFSNGILQLGSPQHGWPIVTPSITTTDTFLPIDNVNWRHDNMFRYKVIKIPG